MSNEINKTNYPPNKPILIWDGECKFCKWWKTRWELKTSEFVEFKPYQKVAKEFPDIPIDEFKKASRLIDEKGNIYSGPDSAYKIKEYTGDSKWHLWYINYTWFKSLSNSAYNHIAKNRNFYYKATVFLFGSEPEKPKIYWFYYLLIIILISISI
tara:strand:- start:22364 stop:22828 length:465 start_codon:yes stop_codon:yes gene_type:complete